MDKVEKWIRRLAFGQFAAICLMLLIVGAWSQIQAQGELGQAVLNERFRSGIQGLEDSVKGLVFWKDQTAPEIAVLKSDMFEVKWLGRAIAGAVLGQFTLSWMGRRRR